jgi:hypothetical protein
MKFFKDDFIGTMDQPLIESDDDKARRLEQESSELTALPLPDLLSAFALPPRPAAAAISQDDTLHSVAAV